ncbi:rab-GTPase-TBC domain-containing protein [Microdochium trichocladiopsis]|uniref:Rab-GTPase-TBC domain-containing protein n=1 Tax=Microdochium trichocladiopsis TaxID=1682393 RepID=A0A9P9BT19_9PEZI|nr:rab-GTPase-TBC domain-containing protein [Microdochium trichocladiopsis]KAH7035174.1 rab-GTPase-TBC domain-containing protein [Microdochium trichocladiopsis]
MPAPASSPSRDGLGPYLAHPHNSHVFASSTTELNPPPSPRTQRTIRKLQSAHNLGAAARFGNAPSLIAQQRLHNLQDRPPSPSRQPSNRSPQRHRANSDARPPQLSASIYGTPGPSSRRPGLKPTSTAANEMSLERLIRDGPPAGDVDGALESARLKVLDQGIKSDSDGMSSTRIYVWLILLDAPIVKTDDYIQLIHRGPSPAYSKIRNDTFRTLTTNPLFHRRVSEASLIRLLNAIAWMLHDAKDKSRPSSSRQSVGPSSAFQTSLDDISQIAVTSSPSASRGRSRALTATTDGSETNASEPGTYVQGMNVLAAPFLYAARSEVEAFVAFHRLLTKECPGYIRGAMDGVHRGLALVDKVLAIVDPKLSLYLTSKGLSAEIYAFPSVLTLCACTPPLPEVLRLWDFLFAYGPHLNVLCIVAQLIIMRNDLLGSPSPNKLLRPFPALQADPIKRTALAIIKMIPDDVYAEITTHAL